MRVLFIICTDNGAVEVFMNYQKMSQKFYLSREDSQLF